MRLERSNSQKRYALSAHARASSECLLHFRKRISRTDECSAMPIDSFVYEMQRRFKGIVNLEILTHSTHSDTFQSSMLARFGVPDIV